jgi:peroxiredoxin
MRRSLSTIVVALAVALLGGLAVRAAEKPEQAEGVRPGDRAPDFALKNQDGKEVKLSDYKGKIVVLQWFNEDCPFIQRHYEAKTFSTLNDKYADRGVVQLAIDSTGASTPQDNQKWVSSHALKFPILQDHDHKVAKAYGARTTPHMFVIDKDGKVAYSGAIDNDPEGDKTDRVNYVAQALNELLAGKSVSKPETKSYGCGVEH